MRKILLYTLFFFIAHLAIGQKKKFVSGLEIVPYLYFDDIHYSKPQWSQLIKPPGQPQTAKIDSFESFDRLRLHINGGPGIQVRGQHDFDVFPEQSTSKLQWNFGLGYRRLNIAGTNYSRSSRFLGFGKDTIESVRFNSHNNLADLYSSVEYRYAGRHIKWLHASAGFGLQWSVPLGRSFVNEAYYLSTYVTSPNTGTQRTVSTDTTIRHPSYQTKILSWTVPLSIGFRLSKRVDLNCRFEYFRYMRSPRVTSIKFSEGGLFSYSVRIAL